MEVAFERKKEKNTELSSACSQAGWRAFVCPVEVGCRGYTGTSTQRFLKSLGILRKAHKDLAEEAEQISFGFQGRIEHGES